MVAWRHAFAVVGHLYQIQAVLLQADLVMDSKVRCSLTLLLLLLLFARESQMGHATQRALQRMMNDALLALDCLGIQKRRSTCGSCCSYRMHEMLALRPAAKHPCMHMLRAFARSPTTRGMRAFSSSH